MAFFKIKNKIKLERNKELYEQGFISKVAYDELKTNYQASLEKINEQNAMKTLPEATWDENGSAYIDEDRNVRVVHKLPEPIQPELEPEDKSQLKLDI